MPPLDTTRRSSDNPDVIAKRILLLSVGALAIATMLLPLAACSRSGSSSCRSVGGHVSALVRADIAASASAEEKRKAELAAGPLADQITRVCENTRWETTTRNCMLQTTSGKAVEECARNLAPAQRLPQAAAK